MTSPQSLDDELCYVITKMDKQIADARKNRDPGIIDLQRRRDEHHKRLSWVDNGSSIAPDLDEEAEE